MHKRDENRLRFFSCTTDINKCIIHCCDDKSDNLTSLKDYESWQSLLKAAKVRNHKAILDVARNTNEGEIPANVTYHRRCRSIFTMKRDLEKLKQSTDDDNDVQEPEIKRYATNRQQPSSSRIYDEICIFCEKKSKYLKSSKNRERLIQCRDLRADDCIRTTSIAKGDTRIIAIVSRELVAAEACYHRSCYRDYTRPAKVTNSDEFQNTDEGGEYDDFYKNIETQAYEKLFEFIRSLLENPRLIKMADLRNLLISHMNSLGVTDTTESTKKYIRRKLEFEFGNLLQFEDLLDNNKLFVIPESLSKVQLAKELAEIRHQQEDITAPSKIEQIQRASLHIRNSILSNGNKGVSWPPKPSELCQEAVKIPGELKAFLHTVLTGTTDIPTEYSQRLERLISSYGQDLMYGVSNGKRKPPKHILLAYTVKSFTNNVELIQMLNRCGHGIAYSQIEEINTALCLQKMASTPNKDVPLPEDIQPYIDTTLAWDNIDRLEETLCWRSLWS